MILYSIPNLCFEKMLPKPFHVQTAQESNLMKKK